jgi:parallel beta-helix repeat protein
LKYLNLLCRKIDTIGLLILLSVVMLSMSVNDAESNGMSTYDDFSEIYKFLEVKSGYRIVSGFDLENVAGKVSISDGMIVHDTADMHVSGKEYMLTVTLDPAQSNPFYYVYVDQTELKLSKSFSVESFGIPLYLGIYDKSTSLCNFIDLRKIDKSTQLLTIKSFAAEKDPDPNHTAGFLAMMKIAAYIDGAKIIVPDGRYIVDGNIKIPGNTSLILGEKALIMKSDATKCDYIFGGDNADNVQIVGGIIDGNRNNSGDCLAALYSTNGSTNWDIRGTKIMNAKRHAVYLDQSSDVNLQDIAVENANGVGIGIFRSEGRISIDGCTVSNTGSNGIEVTGPDETKTPKHVILKGTSVTGSGGNNVSLSYVDGGELSNFKATDSAKHAGLSCKKCMRLTISKSEFSNNRDGMLLNHGSANNRIIENVLKNNEHGGIEIAYDNGHDNHISRNRITENGVRGVCLIDAYHNHITNNIFYDNGKKATKYNMHATEVLIDGKSSGNVVDENIFKTNHTYNLKYTIYSSTKAGTNHLLNNRMEYGNQ